MHYRLIKRNISLHFVKKITLTHFWISPTFRTVRLKNAASIVVLSVLNLESTPRAEELCS